MIRWFRKRDLSSVILANMQLSNDAPEVDWLTLLWRE